MTAFREVSISSRTGKSRGDGGHKLIEDQLTEENKAEQQLATETPAGAPVAAKRLSDSEELANAISHGAAFVIAAIAWMIVLGTQEFSSTASMLAFGVYGISLMLVFLFSTLSHIVREPAMLNRMRAWDQGTIYLLIVGTYTPSIVSQLSGWPRIGVLGTIWAIALFGFYSKVIARHQINAVTTVTYLLLGWLPAMALLPVVTRTFFLWLLAGGICYSLGVVFLVNDRRVPFFHVVWHLFVALAASIHFYAICSMSI